MRARLCSIAFVVKGTLCMVPSFMRCISARAPSLKPAGSLNRLRSSGGNGRAPLMPTQYCVGSCIRRGARVERSSPPPPPNTRASKPLVSSCGSRGPRRRPPVSMSKGAAPRGSRPLVRPRIAKLLKTPILSHNNLRFHG